MMTAAEFRALTGAAFADQERFPDETVAAWLAIAAQRCPAARWGGLRPQGIAFLAAHHLTLIAAAGKSADGTGGLDAAAGGLVSESKSIGGVSKSITRGGGATTADPRAGEYNATSWGQHYWSLAATIGAGGVAL